MATVTKTAFKIQFTNAGFNGEGLTYHSMLEKMMVPFLPLKLAGAAEQRLVYATQEPSVMNQTASRQPWLRARLSRRSCTACDSRRLGSRPARVEGSTTPRPRCILHPARRALAQAAVEFYSAVNTFSWASSGLVTCAARAAIAPVPTEGSNGSSAGRRAASCALEGQQLEEAEGVP